MEKVNLIILYVINYNLEKQEYTLLEKKKKYRHHWGDLEPNYDSDFWETMMKIAMEQ